MIARELMEEGADVAVFTELWAGKCTLVDHNLVCTTGEDSGIASIIDEIKQRNNGKLAGLPDVISLFANGKIAFREAKNIGSKDRLREKQHELTDLLRRIYGDRLDLAIIEWDPL